MINIYTDGACSGNPGEMGLGVFFKDLNSGFSIYKNYGTNNQAELLAIYYALSFITEHKEVTIFTDSAYAIGMLDKGWQAKANINLIQKLKKLISYFDITFKKVKGHAGIEGNEIADTLATKAIKLKQNTFFPENSKFKNSKIFE